MGNAIAIVPEATVDQADAAVAAARATFDGATWHAQPAERRPRVLWRIGDLIDERADELALVEAQPGRPAPLRAR